MTTSTAPRYDFSGRVAVVTGAASGIGAACAEAFVASGAEVIMLDLDADGLAARAETLGDRASGYPVDLTDDTAVEAALADLDRRGVAVHHVVNCAASFIAGGVGASRTDWERSLGVNVIASARLTSRLVPRMPQGSTIVNISSISAHAAQPERWTYNATKAAILALTRGQALDLAPAGIRANAVSPGWIWTPEVARAAEGDRATWEPVWGQYHILRRLGEPAEVAAAVQFLSSDGASFITGAELMADGGYSAIGPEGLGETAQFAGTDAGSR